MSTYYLDTADSTIYVATVILFPVEHPDAPPLVVSANELVREERFLPIDKKLIER